MKFVVSGSCPGLMASQKESTAQVEASRSSIWARRACRSVRARSSGRSAPLVYSMDVDRDIHHVADGPITHIADTP
jgi:hypothetical protein